MGEPVADQVLRKVQQAAELYFRLVLVVAPAGAGKTTALLDVHDRSGAPVVNVNLELSRRMLDLTERQRALQLPRLLSEIVPACRDARGAGRGEATGDPPATTLAEQAGLVLLDNIEILFDVHLKQDPLRLLQGLSRNKTVVATWGGSVVGDRLIYAAPGHPEYRRYPIRDFLVLSPEVTA